MKITRIRIENYKSIEKLDIFPSARLNVFIGENSSGKSNIFDAINWLLGPNYPTFNATTKQDHYLGNENNKIHILLYFEDGYLLDLDESKDRYHFSIKQNGALHGASQALRQKFCAAYVGVEREIVDYLPSDRWSLLGRILLDVNKRFLEETVEGEPKSEKLRKELDKIRDELLFSVIDDSGDNIMDKLVGILKKESASQMNRREEDFQINFNLYDPWNFYRMLQVLVNEPELNLTFQASQMGTGAQAAITIAILRAYSEIKIGGCNPIFIDEPELFLHPQAQRNFYKLLRKLAEENEIQIFYTSHSPYLLSMENFNEVFVVRRSPQKGTYVRNAAIRSFAEDLRIREGICSDDATLKLHYKNAYEQTADSLSALEGFFARKVILIEGESEALVVPYFFEKIGFDYVKEKITIVKCGGKNELDRFYRLYSEFGIPCYVLFDGDKHHTVEEALEHSKKANNELFDILRETEIRDFPDNAVHESYLGFEYDFNHALQFAGFEGVYSESHPEQRSPKGLNLFLKVKPQVENSTVEIPQWISQVRDAVLNLPEEASSVLKKPPEPEEPSELEDLPFD
jgi:putative ATP-dependent endonuclease of OLD family